MPTIHVKPECDLHLQDIANALFKAKKVVVVTGAGISTNSGIPVSFDASLVQYGVVTHILTCVIGLSF